MRERSIRPIPTWIPLGLFLLSGLALPSPSRLDAQAPQEIAFRFAPPLGAPLLDTQRVKVSGQAGHGRGATSSIEVVNRLIYRRAGAQQYEQVQSLVSMSMVLDEQHPDISRLLKVLQGQEIILHLAGDGHFLSLSGGANLLERARQVLSAEVYQAMRPQLDDKEMAARQKLAWERIELFAGKTLVLGQPYSHATQLELPDGKKIEVRETIRVLGRERTADCDCARFESTFSNGPGTPAGTTVTGRGSALIDPDTTLLWSQSNALSVRTKSEISEGFHAPVTVLVTAESALTHGH